MVTAKPAIAASASAWDSHQAAPCQDQSRSPGQAKTQTTPGTSRRTAIPLKRSRYAGMAPGQRRATAALTASDASREWAVKYASQ